jgi:hypothetical protein
LALFNSKVPALFNSKVLTFRLCLYGRLAADIRTDLSTKGTAVAQWLRYCATNQKVAGSIPDVMEFFIDINPSDRTMALGSVDSASNRNEYQEYFLGVNAAGA